MPVKAIRLSMINDCYWYQISEIHVEWLTTKMQWLVRRSAFHDFWPWNEDYWIFQSNNLAASYIKHLICYHYILSWKSALYNNKIMGKIVGSMVIICLYFSKWVHSLPFWQCQSCIRHKVPSSRLFTAIIWVEPSLWRLIGLSGMYPYQLDGDPMKDTWEHTSAESNWLCWH